MPNDKSPPRILMRIELLPQAKEELERFCDRLGMTQIAATSRVIEWFTTQSDVVQAAILGLYPQDIRAEVAKMILNRMGTDKKKRARKS